MVQTRYDSDVQDVQDAENGPVHTPQPGSSATGKEQANLDDLRAGEQKAGGRPTSQFGPAIRAQLVGGLKNFFTSPGAKKWVVGAGIGLFLSWGIALIVLLFLASLFKIPNLAENITEYEFARLIRQIGDSSDRVVQQELTAEASTGIEVAGKRSLYSVFEAKYKGLRDNTWGKFDPLRPNIIMKNLKSSGQLKLDEHIIGFSDVKQNPFQAPLLGKTVLKGVELNGTTYPIERVSIAPGDLLSPGKLFGKLSGFAKLNSEIKFQTDFAPALREALGQEGFGFIRSSLVANKLRQEFGMSLGGLLIGEFRGKTAAQARGIAESQTAKEVTGGGEPAVAEGSVGALNDAEHAVAHETAEVIANPDKAGEIATKTQGVIPNVTKIVADAADENLLQKFVGFANPIYGIALPACIIYEGSLESSGPSVNINTMALQRTTAMLVSVSDQIKAGDTTPEAVGAFDAKVSDTSDANASRRANGLPINTSGTGLSAEANAFGQYTLIDAMPGIGGSGVGSAIKAIASGDPATGRPGACPVLSNLWFGIGGAVVIQGLSIVADFFSGGTASAGEETLVVAADAATETAAKKVTSSFASYLAERLTSKILLSKLRATLLDSGKFAVGITAMTLLAKLIVMARSGQFNVGLEQGDDFANNADAGANIHANELSRAQTFGRPLTGTELTQTSKLDQAFIARNNQEKSFTERYIALDNPNSLLSHTATMINGQLGGSFTKPIANALNIISGPLGFATIMNLASGTSNAATPYADQYYGNVQFGWSTDEEKLIDSDNNYLPLQNQEILDQSGKEEQIAKEYANCFGYRYDDSGVGLDPTDSGSKLQLDATGYEENGDGGSMGALLSSGKILRTEDGDIITDKGLCSPQNLGVHNPTYGDLVFRWRLAMWYDTTVSQLSNLQTVTDQ